MTTKEEVVAFLKRCILQAKKNKNGKFYLKLKEKELKEDFKKKIESITNLMSELEKRVMFPNGINLIKSVQQLYKLPELKEDDYIFKGGKGWEGKEVFVLKTTRNSTINLSNNEILETKEDKTIIEEVKFQNLEKLRVTKDHKILLMFGKTGSGKTTSINSIINYIYGVKSSDKFRLKLIHEQKKENSESKSQTDFISSYFIKKPLKGSNINFDLTIIDTPGIEEDMKILESFKYVFNNVLESISGVNLCFVVNSTDNSDRLSALFNNILNLWGKYAEENIFILMTSVFENKRPNCINAFDNDSVLKHCKNRYKVNNLAFKKDPNTKDFDPNNLFYKMFWAMSMNSFKKFFEGFSKISYHNGSLISYHPSKTDNSLNWYRLKSWVTDTITKDGSNKNESTNDTYTVTVKLKNKKSSFVCEIGSNLDNIDWDNMVNNIKNEIKDKFSLSGNYILQDVDEIDIDDGDDLLAIFEDLEDNEFNGLLFVEKIETGITDTMTEDGSNKNESTNDRCLLKVIDEKEDEKEFIKIINCTGKEVPTEKEVFKVLSHYGRLKSHLPKRTQEYYHPSENTYKKHKKDFIYYHNGLLNWYHPKSWEWYHSQGTEWTHTGNLQTTYKHTQTWNWYHYGYLNTRKYHSGRGHWTQFLYCPHCNKIGDNMIVTSGSYDCHWQSCNISMGVDTKLLECRTHYKYYHEYHCYWKKEYRHDCCNKIYKIEYERSTWSDDEYEIEGCMTESKWSCCGRSSSDSGCRRKYGCCSRSYGSSGCTSDTKYSCCNRSRYSIGCHERYKCCKNNKSDSGCKKRYKCCKNNKSDSGCKKRSKCCNREFSNSGCKRKYNCCGSDYFVTKGSNENYNKGCKTKYPCCNGAKDSKGCEEYYSCCHKKYGQSSNGCKFGYSCCDSSGRSNGCKTVYTCCGGDKNSKGCVKA